MQQHRCWFIAPICAPVQSSPISSKVFGEGNLSGAISNHSHELSLLKYRLRNKKLLAITVRKTANFASFDSELGKVTKAQRRFNTWVTFWDPLEGIWFLKQTVPHSAKLMKTAFLFYLICVDCLMINLQFFLVRADIWVCLLPCDLFSLNVRECNTCKTFTPPPDNVIEIDWLIQKQLGGADRQTAHKFSSVRNEVKNSMVLWDILRPVSIKLYFRCEEGLACLIPCPFYPPNLSGGLIKDITSSYKPFPSL